MYLKRIKILNKEVVSNNEFYAMCMEELHHKHNDHQTLQRAMLAITVREADLVKRIIDLEIRNNTLEKNPRHVYEKIPLEGKRAKYKLMTESMQHITSQMK